MSHISQIEPLYRIRHSSLAHLNFLFIRYDSHTGKYLEVLQFSLNVFEMKFPKPSPTGTPGYDLVSTIWDTTSLKVASSHCVGFKRLFWEYHIHSTKKATCSSSYLAIIIPGEVTFSDPIHYVLFWESTQPFVGLVLSPTPPVYLKLSNNLSSFACSSIPSEADSMGMINDDIWLVTSFIKNLLINFSFLDDPGYVCKKKKKRKK